MNRPSDSQTSNRWFALSLAVAAAGLICASLKLPLWQMRLEAPQYRGEEALNVVVYPNTMRGDLQELALLNQYIGVRVPEQLPQFQWLPGALLTAAILGIGAVFLPVAVRRKSLMGVPVALSAALLIAAVQAHKQMHAIGHNRDPHAALVGLKDFTPPLLGTRKIAQFEVASRLGLGAWVIGGGLGLFLGAAWMSRQRRTGFQPVSNFKSISHGEETGGRLETCPALR